MPNLIREAKISDSSNLQHFYLINNLFFPPNLAGLSPKHIVDSKDTAEWRPLVVVAPAAAAILRAETMALHIGAMLLHTGAILLYTGTMVLHMETDTSHRNNSARRRNDGTPQVGSELSTRQNQGIVDQQYTAPSPMLAPVRNPRGEPSDAPLVPYTTSKKGTQDNNPNAAAGAEQASITEFEDTDEELQGSETEFEATAPNSQAIAPDRPKAPRHRFNPKEPAELPSTKKGSHSGKGKATATPGPSRTSKKSSQKGKDYTIAISDSRKSEEGSVNSTEAVVGGQSSGKR